MTASDWRKMLKQFRRNPAMREKYIKHNKPKERTTGIARKKCEKMREIWCHDKFIWIEFM